MSRDELGHLKMKHEVKKAKFMLTCKQASQLISQSLDRPLPLSGRVKLRFHLFICDACTRFHKQMGQLRYAVHHMRQTTENDSTIELPSDAKARISNAVASKHH